MGVEPPPGTRASAGANAHAHQRICTCHPATQRAGSHASGLTGARCWVWSTCRCHPPRKAGRISGQDFPLQPDGTLQCPAGKPLHPQEQRREADGSLRGVYAASIRDCRPCRLRKPRQWNGGETSKPRQVSVRLASPRHREGAAALVRLESKGSSAGMHASGVSPASGGPPGAPRKTSFTGRFFVEQTSKEGKTGDASEGRDPFLIR